MQDGKIISIEDRIPKLKEQRKRKTNRRLILLLSIFFLLILLVVYFQSPLSRVSEINVVGSESLNTKNIIKKSGLSKKSNIWNIDKESIEKKLLTIPEIKSAAIKIQFPNSVNIKIKEHKSIAYMTNGVKFYPVLENGAIIKNQSIEHVINAPILSDFQKGKILTETVEQLQELPTEIVNSISEIHYSPKKTDRYHLTLYMNDGYEVSATMRTLSEKLVHYPSIIKQLDPKVKGTINLEVGSYFEPFDLKGEHKDEEQESKN